MKTLVITVSLGLAILMLAGCGAANNTAANKGPDAAKPTAAPTVDALLALDKQANEAYLKSDAKFFDGMLSDRFVMYEAGQRMEKAAVIKMIAGNKCDVKAWKLEDPRMARIDTDTYVLSYKGTFAGSCTGPGGKAMEIPSPIRAATVWLRSGDKWMAAFHGQNLLVDPKDPPSSAKARSNKEGPKKDSKAAAHSSPAVTKPAPDSNTDAMMAIEQSLWEAWMAKDGKKLEALTATELSFQNIYGTFFANKADTLKDWTGPGCDVKSVRVSDGAGILLSPTVGLLTRTGTAEGTCGGQTLTPVPIYGVSVFVKDGDSWKLAFSLNQL
ncbi:MAG: nuclear transport factor 2 family protein [Candidatus Koribacter versatilis]|uniref:Nuclear transport factor 2 family protein n=1 Tax=Candidatus Korobacter versatilis TaxID=658062 RepID=A0A932A665_9BACT|nr:nuclear transport factor 2 family protein [Candidatus Koribacter versatilis]